MWHLLPTLPLPFVPHKGGEWRQSPLAQVCQVLRAGDKVGEAGREGHGMAWHGHAALSQGSYWWPGWGESPCPPPRWGCCNHPGTGHKLLLTLPGEHRAAYLGGQVGRYQPLGKMG